MATLPPTQRETLAPYIRRIKRSLPNSSVPNKYAPPGALKRSDTDIAFGSTELISGTKTAAVKMTRNPIVPITNAGFPKILSFVSSLCSLKIVLLASDILLRVKYIFRHLLFQSWPKSRIHKTIQYIYCQIHNHI